MKYLYIFEDGSYKLYNEVHDADLTSVADGILEILNLETQQYYLDFKWRAIEIG